ncbi:hypothetical protein [Mycobacterium sp. M23085]|uniref:hypothetical protein n=1 Tax=Mycobacterium sp. M23085 TaxID=3378087 RepID=UPI003877FC59
MAFKINPHVERLHRYLPFDASHDQIYEENRHPDDSLEIETRALAYLKKVLGDGAGLVILTGDAGHGKTHLCSRLIRDHLGYDPETARRTIREHCDGRVLEPSTAQGGRQRLRIFKDFSELTLATARSELAGAATDKTSTSIVCVNEGRLRSIFAGADNPHLVVLRQAFGSSFSSGLASADGKLHIVNLNYQSVAKEENSVIERVLSGEGQRLGWLAQRRWNACDNCDASGGCPIRRNAAMLDGPEGQNRRDRVREVMAIAERLGTVITIREILMTVAYLLTGGLRCADVHREYTRQKFGWQHEFTFYSLLFTNPSSLSRDKLARIPLLRELRPLDPGLVAERHVDDRLINDPDTLIDASFELVFTKRFAGRDVTIDAKNGIDEIVANARSREQRDDEADFTREVIRGLRRRDFFDHHGCDGIEAGRLGFGFYDNFRWLLGDQQDNNRKVRIKNRLIAGLHTIQGLRLPGSENTLHLVDPAFGRSTNHAAIIARKIPSRQIKLVPQSEGWDVPAEQRRHSLTEAVDWIDRVVLLTVETATGHKHTYPLDLLTFDCIMRAASGYLPDAFYAHDVRRITNFLGLLAERGRQSDHDSIDVMVSGRMHTVALEEGDVIVVSGD